MLEITVAFADVIDREVTLFNIETYRKENLVIPCQWPQNKFAIPIRIIHFEEYDCQKKFLRIHGSKLNNVQQWSDFMSNIFISDLIPAINAEWSSKLIFKEQCEGQIVDILYAKMILMFVISGRISSASIRTTQPRWCPQWEISSKKSTKPKLVLWSYPRMVILVASSIPTVNQALRSFLSEAPEEWPNFISSKLREEWHWSWSIWVTQVYRQVMNWIEFKFEGKNIFPDKKIMEFEMDIPVKV